MKFDLLNSHDIYALPYGGRLYLYAPLAGVLAETNMEEMRAFESIMSLGMIPDEISELCKGEAPHDPYMPDEIPEITILVNQKCNFTCKYCYSANGRSTAELSSELFAHIVEWFVNPSRLQLSGAGALSVTFSGGGDPMLSDAKVEELVHMFRRQASAKGVPLSVGVVCNGSLVSDATAMFLAANVDDIVISFDVLEDVHNAQRSHYSVVARTIRNLCGKGIRVGLRSTITALNVGRMTEMVEVLSKEFPACRSIAMEAVLSPSVWKNLAELHDFYSRFVDGYYNARTVGERCGVSVGNTVDLSADGLKSRACPGKVSIAPDGTLTACSRVATPGDVFFYDFSFGKVDADGVGIDIQKYRRLMDWRAGNMPECNGCFAKYHCGGGCTLARWSYDKDQMLEYCRFTRSMLLKSLTYELD